MQADKPIRPKRTDLIGDPCSAQPCKRAGKVDGLCPFHLAESLRAAWPLKPDGVCIVPICEDPTLTSGWCRGHYRRQQNRGELLPDVPIRKNSVERGATCVEPGCRRVVKILSLALCTRHNGVRYKAEIKSDPSRHDALKKYQRERKRAEFAKDPAKVLARAKAWKARNPERMKFHYANKQRKRGLARRLKFTVDQLRDRMAYWGFRCWICRAPYEAIDHVKPIARGGWHALMNLRPICTPCNSSKGYRWPFPTGTTT